MRSFKKKKAQHTCVAKVKVKFKFKNKLGTFLGSRRSWHSTDTTFSALLQHTFGWVHFLRLFIYFLFFSLTLYQAELSSLVKAHKNAMQTMFFFFFSLNLYYREYYKKLWIKIHYCSYLLIINLIGVWKLKLLNLNFILKIL